MQVPWNWAPCPAKHQIRGISLVSQFCSNCGASLHAGANYCDECGAAAISIGDCLLPVRRVVILALISAGFYLFWWLYITWKHYRDHRNETAFPIWHALTLMVPVYNLFRVHAHFRTYRELMEQRQLVTSLSPIKAVIVIIICFLVTIREFFYDEASDVFAVGMLITFAISVFLVTWLLAVAQANINRYWQSVAPEGAFASISIGEVALTIIGACFWLNAALFAVSESYRMI